MTRRSPLLIPFALLLIGCLAQAAPASQRRWEYLQPSTHESANGAFVLHQDPSDREGRGSARLTLRRLGETIWSAEHPFTFWELLVSNRGEVFGYSYSSPPRPFAKGETRIVLISPRGRVLVDEAHSRVYNPVYAGQPHPSPLPYVRGLHLREDLGLGIVQVAIPHDNTRNVTPWWSYDLSTGAVHAKGEDELAENSAFVRDGAFVPEPVSAEGEEPVSRRAPGAWDPLPPRLELESLPSVKLQNSKRERESSPTLENPVPELFLEKVFGATIEGCGRIVIVDESTRFVHVFNSAGQCILVARGPRQEVGAISAIFRITISGRGRVFAESRIHPSLEQGRRDETYAVFDESGRFVERRHLEMSKLSFVKGTEHCWGDRDGRLLLLDEEQNILRRLDRRPDGNFWDISALAAGKGREPAVRDRRILVYYDDRNPLGRMVSIPVFPLPGDLAHGGRWIVLYGRGPGCLLFDTLCDQFHHVDLSADFPEDSSPDCGFSADGTELWALEGSELVLHRYTLPVD